jgi:transcriptional regulator with XRE-family HTH domain
MRGMMAKLTIGERVAWYRRRRGMSQEVLAGLVGRTSDWLGKIENNRIELDRLSVIKSLADVLDVSLGDLLAEPSLLDWNSESGLETVPALRPALMEYRGITALGTADTGQEPPDLAGLRRETSELWDAYQGSRGRLSGLSLRIRHRPASSPARARPGRRRRARRTRPGGRTPPARPDLPARRDSAHQARGN